MFRIRALAITSLAVMAMALGPGPTVAGPMATSSPGQGSGDWDIDTNTTNAKAGQPASLGSEFFRVEWTSQPAGDGRSRLTGYVYDDYGQPAKDVQLRIGLVDPATGQASESVIRPVRGLVPGEGRAYFDVTVPASPAYQVSVATFTFLEFGKGS